MANNNYTYYGGYSPYLNLNYPGEEIDWSEYIRRGAVPRNLLGSESLAEGLIPGGNDRGLAGYDVPTSVGTSYGYLGTAPSLDSLTGPLSSVAATTAGYGALAKAAGIPGTLGMQVGLEKSLPGAMTQGTANQVSDDSMLNQGILGALATAFGPVGAGIGAIASPFAKALGGVATDAMDNRKFESGLDALEDQYGYTNVSEMMNALGADPISHVTGITGDTIHSYEPGIGQVDLGVKELLEKAAQEHSSRFESGKFSKDQTNAIWGGASKNPETDIAALARNISNDPGFYGYDSRRKAEAQLGLEDGSLDAKAKAANEVTTDASWGKIGASLDSAYNAAMGKLSNLAGIFEGAVPESTQDQVENPEKSSMPNRSATESMAKMNTEVSKAKSKAQENNEPSAPSSKSDKSKSESKGKKSGGQKDSGKSEGNTGGGNDGGGAPAGKGGSNGGKKGGDSRGGNGKPGDQSSEGPIGGR